MEIIRLRLIVEAKCVKFSRIARENPACGLYRCPVKSFRTHDFVYYSGA
jgi:hypothetical protein